MTDPATQPWAIVDASPDHKWQSEVYLIGAATPTGKYVKDSNGDLEPEFAHEELVCGAYGQKNAYMIRLLPQIVQALKALRRATGDINLSDETFEAVGLTDSVLAKLSKASQGQNR